MSETWIKTIEQKCVGCNKCMLSCPIDDANVSYRVGSQNKIHIDHSRCILCGKCLEVCDHMARDYEDDTERFFSDLANGDKISILVAPSFKTNFANYRQLVGYLKHSGVQQAYDVAFGADLVSWAYLRSLNNNNSGAMIAQPCPSVVSYIQKYAHEIMPKLAPIQSPALCLGIYLKQYLGVKEKLCLVSPCIAKTKEINDKNTHGHIHYNITFKKLLAYLKKQGVDLNQYEAESLELPAQGLGNIISQPGGLKENLHFYDRTAWVKQIEGIEYVYEYIEEYARRKQEGRSLPSFVDALNCSGGCNFGSGSCKNIDVTDVEEIFSQLRVDRLSLGKQEINEILECFDRTLSLDDFRRDYTCEWVDTFREPTEREYELIFDNMKKLSDESQHINCNACGYRSCQHMAKAIFNGLNHKENCIDYNSKLTIYLQEKRHREVEGLLEQVTSKSDELEKTNRRLKELDSVKSEFISTVSHELRTPLTSVLGFTKIIRKKLEEVIIPHLDTTDKKVARTVEQVKGNVDIIISESERLTNLINDVLDLAKMEAGKVEWRNESVDMGEILERAMTATTALHVAKGLTLQKVVEKDLPFIAGDSDRLIQVIINLISNAVKFTEAGSIICRAERAGEGLRVSVEDTGIGIPKEELTHIFEEFKQLGNTLIDKPKGTGLGLSICKQIVEHHGGRIWAESEVGKGTKFCLSLPICQGSHPTNLERMQALQIDQGLPEERRCEGSNKVLVVDDEKSIRRLIRQELEEVGYCVEEASNGLEAISRIKASRPSVVILDIVMPGMNGFDVAAVIKNDPETRDIPIIILSILEEKSRGSNIGVERYFTKPLDSEQLLCAVEQLMTSGQVQESVVVINEESAEVLEII